MFRVSDHCSALGPFMLLFFRMFPHVSPFLFCMFINNGEHAYAGQVGQFYTSKSPNWYSLPAACFFSVYLFFYMFISVRLISPCFCVHLSAICASVSFFRTFPHVSQFIFCVSLLLYVSFLYIYFPHVCFYTVKPRGALSDASRSGLPSNCKLPPGRKKKRGSVNIF